MPNTKNNKIIKGCSTNL